MAFFQAAAEGGPSVSASSFLQDQDVILLMRYMLYNVHVQTYVYPSCSWS